MPKNPDGARPASPSILQSGLPSEGSGPKPKGLQPRWRLTRFWSRVGEAVYVDRIIDLQTLMRYLEGSHRIIQMLAYLEVSLIRWTRESGMGGRWFFQLNRDWDAG
jgi:hypothetical protein